VHKCLLNRAGGRESGFQGNGTLSEPIAKYEKVPVLVLGTGITALGVIRSLAAAGIRAYCVSDRLGFVEKSRFCRSLAGVHDPLHAGDDLNEFLSRLSLEQAVLVPCSDDWVLAASQIRSELTDRFPISQPDTDTVQRLVDKGTLYAILSEHDLPHPRTIALNTEADLERFPADHNEWFLKPRDSATFFKRFWVKAFRVRTPDEARQRYQEAAAHHLHMLLQEYIPGPPTNHYFVDGFVDRHGRLCAAFARQRIRMYPPDFGNSSYMTSIAPEEVQAAIDSLRTLFSVVSYRGVYSAEFKLDDRDGLFKLLEINIRPWWYISFADMCGVPIALMQYRDALGLQVEPSMQYKVGVSLVYHYYDLHNFIRLRREGKLGLLPWLRSWLRAKAAVFAWTDPLPSLAWSFDQMRQLLRKRLFGRENT
jgi:D-aspartate ligase